jgi:uncharacterized protein
VDLVAVEKDKIEGAVRTDFILSAEIVTITLGTVAEAPLLNQIAVLSGVSLMVTIGVYGLVAAIVKMDDAGLYLSQQGGQGGLAASRRQLGLGLLAAAPVMMRILSVVGTAAMFLVGGVHDLVCTGQAMQQDAAEHAAQGVPVVGGALAAVTPMLLDGLGGIATGAIVLAVVTMGQKIMGLFRRG